MDWIVRFAERDEAPVLAQLHLETALAAYGHIFPTEAPPPTLEDVVEQWTRWLGPDWELGRRVFVAEGGGAPVGVVLAGPDINEPEVGHVARLYVKPDRWGEGIGTALYEMAIRHLREVGFREATLRVLERNERACRWYERLGWHPTGERIPVYAPAGIDDLSYRLRL